MSTTRVPSCKATPYNPLPATIRHIANRSCQSRDLGLYKRGSLLIIGSARLLCGGRHNGSPSRLRAVNSRPRDHQSEPSPACIRQSPRADRKPRFEIMKNKPIYLFLFLLPLGLAAEQAPSKKPAFSYKGPTLSTIPPAARPDRSGKQRMVPLIRAKPRLPAPSPHKNRLDKVPLPKERSIPSGHKENLHVESAIPKVRLPSAKRETPSSAKRPLIPRVPASFGKGREAQTTTKPGKDNSIRLKLPTIGRLGKPHSGMDARRQSGFTSSNSLHSEGSSAYDSPTIRDTGRNGTGRGVFNDMPHLGFPTRPSGPAPNPTAPSSLTGGAGANLDAGPNSGLFAPPDDRETGGDTRQAARPPIAKMTVNENDPPQYGPPVKDPTNQPKYEATDGGSFVWSDGSAVPAFGPDGSMGKINDKGDVVYADGTTIVNDGRGNWTIFDPEGRPTGATHGPDTTPPTTGVPGPKQNAETNSSLFAPQDDSGGGDNAQPSVSDQERPQYGPPVKDPTNQPKYDATDGGSFVWSDGSAAPAVGTDGSMGKINDKGDVVYADGTTIVNDGRGNLTIFDPEGRATGSVANPNSTPYTPDDSGTDHRGETNPSPTASSSDGAAERGAEEESETNQQSETDDPESSEDHGSNSDDSGNSDTNSDSDDTTDTGESGDTDTEGADERGTGSGTPSDGPDETVEGIVARARGEQQDPESGQPEECTSEGMGGSTTQPGSGGQRNCVPTGMPGIAPDDTSAPDAGESATATDRRSHRRASIGDQIGQPNLEDEGLRGGDLPSLSPFDRNPVTNPGRP